MAVDSKWLCHSRHHHLLVNDEERIKIRVEMIVNERDSEQ
jgi:hypothetical protein